MARKQTESDEFFDAQELLFLRQGSREAFTNVFKRYHGRIYGIALRYLRSPDLAKEVVQEVFLTLWKKRQELAYIETLESYILTSAKNAAHHSFKKTKQVRRVEGEYAARRVTSEQASADDYLLDKQYEELIEKAVGQLTPQKQEVFKLARYEHLTHDEIAKRMNISKLSVKTYMRDALKIIRENLDPHISFTVFLSFHILNLEQFL